MRQGMLVLCQQHTPLCTSHCAQQTHNPLLQRPVYDVGITSIIMNVMVVQVHGGNLHDGRRFAMKIQYPGVARSIESDVDNLMRLISIANLLPKGLYVEQAAEVGTMQPSEAE